MIRVRFVLDKDERIASFYVKGHAQSAKHGKDIVCAAVSAVAQTAIIGLEEYVHIIPAVRQEPGDLSCFLPDEVAAEQKQASEAILRTCYLGLLAIKESHPRYLTVEMI